MANFLSNALGNDGIAKMAGEKVGDLVEDTIKNVMGGKEKQEGEKEGEKKEENKGGFDVGDALSLVGGNKKEEEGGGGLDVKNVIGGLFK
ncbi:uncharacterized protein LOC111224206 isoform X2 [Scomber scombrus]|uniref:Uncharacterized protein LOC111224206 isoform X2 n=1 Tax=Scomber scombrus TaxID=13677 RepID=A0AAV1QA57_SCOSC